MPTQKRVPASTTTRSRKPMILAPALVQQSWIWYAKNWQGLLGICAITFAPALLQSWVMTTLRVLHVYKDPNIALLTIGLVSVLIFLLWVFSTLWTLWGTAALYVYILRGGKRLTPWKSFLEARQYFLYYMATNVIVALIVAGGMFLLFVPGIYWAVQLSFASLVVIAEKKNLSGSLRRSGELVRGYWWSIVGRSALMMLTVVLAGLVLFGVVALLALFISAFSAIVGLYAMDVFRVFMSVCITPLTAVLLVFMYRDLKKLHSARAS